MSARFTYQMLVELVHGDHELIARLVEEGFIEPRDDDGAMVDINRVLVAQTLWRDLDIEWPGIEVILRLCDELAAARRQIAQLQARLGDR